MNYLLIIGKVLAAALAVAIAWFAFNTASHLLNQSNDLAVLVGYLIYVVIATMAVLIAWPYLKKWRKPHLVMAILAVSTILTTGCYKVVEPGHVGILVKQTGSDRGVQDYPVQTGRVFYNPLNENVLVYPTMVQRAIWTANRTEGSTDNEEFSFQSKEGMHFTADVNCSYELSRDKIPQFYVRFRNDNLNAFTHGFLRDTIRNSLNHSTDYTAEEINGSRQSDLINQVTQDVKAKVEPLGLNILQIGFVAPPRPPEAIKQAIQQKIAAIQRAEQAENEKREAIAQGEKIKALASATAEANRAINASLTPALVQWRQLDVLQSKWDGRLPQVTGSGSGVSLLMSAPVK